MQLVKVICELALWESACMLKEVAGNKPTTYVQEKEWVNGNSIHQDAITNRIRHPRMWTYDVVHHSDRMVGM